MYHLFIWGLLIFPWLVTIHIALGAFRAARSRTITADESKRLGGAAVCGNGFRGF